MTLRQQGNTMDQQLERIDQPVLLIDEEGTRKNIDRMVSTAHNNRVSFRPHFKTHQSAEIGEWFREKGVSRITVSSVEMAEYFADHGWEDILLAFSFNPRQLDRIQALARRIHLGVLLENEVALSRLDRSANFELAIWIKIDVGNHRTGLDWADEYSVSSLIARVREFNNLHCEGLLTHSGHTYHASNQTEVCSLFREGIERLEKLRGALEAGGHAGLKISVGDTPGCTLCRDWSGIDEVRPGNFVFYDAMQAAAGVCAFEDVSVAVACPVVAKHPDRREVVIYGGAVHLSKDYLEIEGKRSYGIPALQCGDRWGDPIENALVVGLSQEHGIVHIPGDVFEKISIGDLLFILPAHSCLTVQILGSYLTLDGRKISTLNR